MHGVSRAQRHANRIRPLHVFDRCDQVGMGHCLLAADGVDELLLNAPAAHLFRLDFDWLERVIATPPRPQFKL